MITIVQENFGIKNFSDAKWCLKIKYSKYVLQQNIHGQKKLRKRTQTCASTRSAWAVIKKVSSRCSYNLEFAMLILTYFKPMDGLPNHKGPCHC